MTPDASHLDRAKAFERGIGVKRDYRKAVSIYELACSGGNGDLTACHRLLDSMSSARGVAFDRPRVAVVAKTLCERRDALGCTIASMFGDAVSLKVLQELPDPDDGCAKGDARACEAALASQFPNFQGSSGVEERQKTLHHQACKVGVLAGCLALIEEVKRCSYEAGAARCVDGLLREWKKYDSTEPLEALARVRSECDQGDARACDSLPGREIAHATLCSAHDYEACGVLGCLGDWTAAKLAAEQGATPNCGVAERREQAKTAPPPPSRPALPAEPAPSATTPANRSGFAAIAFRQLETDPDDWSWPKFEIYNLGAKRITALRTVGYAYDKQGTQVARSDERSFPDLDVEPGKSMIPDHLVYSSSGIPPEAVSFDVCHDFIGFDRRANWINAVRCPGTKPKGVRAAPLTGAGSLVQARLHAVAARSFAQTPLHYWHPNGNSNDPKANTSASGSGLDELTASTVAFAGTEVVSNGPDRLHIPVLIGAIGVIYNLRGVKNLRLSAATLAKIYQHDITRWNDKAIAADNPGAKLPDMSITAYHDPLDVDATQQLAGYLERAAGGVWRQKSGAALTWPANAKMAMGIVSITAMRDGAIGYADLSAIKDAAQGSQLASLRNRAGTFVLPTPASATAAGRDLGNTFTSGAIDARSATAYPLAYASWATVSTKQSDPSTSKMLVAYLEFLLADGQDLLGDLGLGRLPPALVKSARARLQSIK